MDDGNFFLGSSKGKMLTLPDFSFQHFKNVFDLFSERKYLLWWKECDF